MANIKVKFLLEIMTPVSSANNTGSDTECNAA
jgi:hypothetical protein